MHPNAALVHAQNCFCCFVCCDPLDICEQVESIIFLCWWQPRLFQEAENTHFPVLGEPNCKFKKLSHASWNLKMVILTTAIKNSAQATCGVFVVTSQMLAALFFFMYESSVDDHMWKGDADLG